MAFANPNGSDAGGNTRSPTQTIAESKALYRARPYKTKWTEIGTTPGGTIPSNAYYRKNPYVGLTDYTRVYQPTRDPVVVNVVRPTLQELGDASIEFGKSSRFSLVNDEPQKEQPEYDTFTVTDFGTTVDEFEREMLIVRIFNEEDHSQYVDVQRATRSRFRDSAGNVSTFNWKT